MGSNVTSHGPHTWPIVHDYHKCPNCGIIAESRIPYEYRLGEYQKEVHCGKCKKDFTVARHVKPALGPLWNAS